MNCKKENQGKYNTFWFMHKYIQMSIHRVSFRKIFGFLKQDRLLSSDGRNKKYEVLTERKTILYECEMCHISSWIVEILHTPFNKVKFYECKSVRKLWKCKQFTMPVAVCV